MLENKKFLSPVQLRKRFNFNPNEYENLIDLGLPTYTCAGVTRHPIDEVYLWCEKNRVAIRDQNNLCSGRKIRELLGISDKNLKTLEQMGLPKVIQQKGGFRKFMYDKEEVINWFKSQQDDMVGV